MGSRARRNVGGSVAGGHPRQPAWSLVALWLATLALAAAAAGASAQSRHAGPGPFAGASVGTARLPASEPMQGLHVMAGSLALMAHAALSLGHRWDPDPRGERDAFLTNMAGLTVRRPIGAAWLELSARASLEPVMGPRGYSLLLQTGETADGVLPLVDRQHPHDALMELSASLRVEIEEGVWAFLYVAPVGSPALGPVPYMHRPSGALNPVAPISHHFMDATHVTHGVLTGGVSSDVLQAEASWFGGLEPDVDRWIPDAPALDSWSVRLTLTPGSAWALQGSFAALSEPERLHPALDLYRSTVSVMHRAKLAERASLSTTLAWGGNTRPRTTMSIGEARARFSGPLLEHYLGVAQLPPGADDTLLLLFDKRSQWALLAESTLSWGPTHVFGRFERARKDELFPPPDPRHSGLYWVSKLDGGMVVEIARAGGLHLALGATASLHWMADDLTAAYGGAPRSYMLFTRITL